MDKDERIAIALAISDSVNAQLMKEALAVKVLDPADLKHSLMMMENLTDGIGNSKSPTSETSTSVSKGEFMGKCYVYMIRSGESQNNPIKIGMASDPHRRIKELQTGNPCLLYMVMTIECQGRKEARRLEKKLHELLETVNVLGEWYKANRQQLYKVLKRMSKDETCKIVEPYQLRKPVSHERQLLRNERKRTENLKRCVREAELSAGRSKRSTRCSEKDALRTE